MACQPSSARYGGQGRGEGFGRDEDRRRSEEAGFDRHVTNPLDPRSLLSLISQADN
jgi:hypothetical protein